MLFLKMLIFCKIIYLASTQRKVKLETLFLPLSEILWVSQLVFEVWNTIVNISILKFIKNLSVQLDTPVSYLLVGINY